MLLICGGGGVWFILQQSMQRVGPGELEAEPVVQEALQAQT